MYIYLYSCSLVLGLVRRKPKTNAIKFHTAIIYLFTIFRY